MRKSLGPNRTLIATLFALWAIRKRDVLLTILTRISMIALGLGGYGYWHGFFS
jgi:hypothetical protein